MPGCSRQERKQWPQHPEASCPGLTEAWKKSDKKWLTKPVQVPLLFLLKSPSQPESDLWGIIDWWVNLLFLLCKNNQRARRNITKILKSVMNKIGIIDTWKIMSPSTLEMTKLSWIILDEWLWIHLEWALVVKFPFLSKSAKALTKYKTQSEQQEHPPESVHWWI